MATKKRRKKIAPPIVRPGRKKELKRFELELWTNEDMRPDPVSDRAVAANEVAFVVRTSGGTPLNTTDVKKLTRILQHELRHLGHKLKRKGQELDPEPPQQAKPPEENSGAPSEDPEIDAQTGNAQAEITPVRPVASDAAAEAQLGADDDLPQSDTAEADATSDTSDLADPDDSDAENQATT